MIAPSRSAAKSSAPFAVPDLGPVEQLLGERAHYGRAVAVLEGVQVASRGAAPPPNRRWSIGGCWFGHDGSSSQLVVWRRLSVR